MRHRATGNKFAGIETSVFARKSTNDRKHRWLRSEARSKWLHRLRSRLYDVMGNNLKMSLVSWSVERVLYCFKMMRRNE